MISRDWRCLNDDCGHVFHSYEKANPPCPTCGCMRVDWVPAGGHILSGRTKRMDQSVRSIAAQHGMTNLNSPSPSRNDRAAPKIDVPPLSPELGVKHWGMGIASEFSRHGPVCVESSNAINLRGKVSVGPNAIPATPSSSVPGPGANMVLAGRTLQRTIR